MWKITAQKVFVEQLHRMTLISTEHWQGSLSLSLNKMQNIYQKTSIVTSLTLPSHKNNILDCLYKNYTRHLRLMHLKYIEKKLTYIKATFFLLISYKNVNNMLHTNLVHLILQCKSKLFSVNVWINSKAICATNYFYDYDNTLT